MVSTVSSNQEGLSVWSVLSLCLHEFSLGYSRFLTQSKDMQVKSISDSKVPIGIDIDTF